MLLMMMAMKMMTMVMIIMIMMLMVMTMIMMTMIIMMTMVMMRMMMMIMLPLGFQARSHMMDFQIFVSLEAKIKLPYMKASKPWSEVYTFKGVKQLTIYST